MQQSLSDTPHFSIPRSAALWAMFFLICFGLGYPTLNRYDPSKTPSTPDAQKYFDSVIGRDPASDQMRHRILVPYLARPIYKIANGRIGSWNPVAFSLLVVNSAFCAAAVVILFYLAMAFGLSLAAALIASCAYLLNFSVANDQLAGLVDSGEALLIMVLILVLWRRAWNLLPVLGIVGALAKETFIPIAFLFAIGWVWREERKPWLQIAGLMAAGLLTVSLIPLFLVHQWGTPLDSAMQTERTFQWSAFVHPFIGVALWLTFLWPLPFAKLGLQALPKQSLPASLFAAAGVYAMAVWGDVGANASRPLFNVLGPCLCIAFSAGITTWRSAR